MICINRIPVFFFLPPHPTVGPSLLMGDNSIVREGGKVSPIATVVELAATIDMAGAVGKNNDFWKN